MGIPIETMESDVFGQLAEQVWFGRGDYDDKTKDLVRKRLFADVYTGQVIGKTVVFRVTHDGEVGSTIDAQPRHKETRDPLAYGV